MAEKGNVVGNEADAILVALVALFLAIYFYFLPTITAAYRKHHNQKAIFLVNLLLGWTLLGWIAALVWSATAVNPISTSQPQPQPHRPTIQYSHQSRPPRGTREPTQSIVGLGEKAPWGRRRTLIMNGQNAYLCSDDYRDVIETLKGMGRAAGGHSCAVRRNDRGVFIQCPNANRAIDGRHWRRSMPHVRAETTRTCMSSRGAGEAKGNAGQPADTCLFVAGTGAR